MAKILYYLKNKKWIKMATVKFDWCNRWPESVHTLKQCYLSLFLPASGLVSLTDWASAVESVMRLGLPWRMLRYQLVTCKTSDGMIDYYDWFNELAIKGPNTDVSMGAFQRQSENTFLLHSPPNQTQPLCEWHSKGKNEIKSKKSIKLINKKGHSSSPQQQDTNQTLFILVGAVWVFGLAVVPPTSFNVIWRCPSITYCCY